MLFLHFLRDSRELIVKSQTTSRVKINDDKVRRNRNKQKNDSRYILTHAIGVRVIVCEAHRSKKVIEDKKLIEK